MPLDFGSHSNKVCSANRAVSKIAPGSHVFVGTACATPRALIHALESVVNVSDDITVLSFITDGAVPHENGLPVSKCRHKCFFVGRDQQEAIRGGTAEYIPMSLAQLPILMKNGRFPIDVSLIQVSAPDRNGYVSLGVSVDIGLNATRVSKKVIAEVNPNMPFTFGDSVIHLDHIDHLVINDTPVYEYVHPPADDVARQVAAYIAGIIDDGSTLQIGLGRVPNAALPYLFDRKDLGIHSDVITEGLLDLIERGIITGRKKTLHREKVVTSYCLGTKRLYDYVHLNQMFEFRPIEYICDPSIIARNYRMVSVTQAFAVDLTGQICTDQLEGNFYGGVSTQPDFLRGAAKSPGGKPIVCLRSTSEDGKQSLIRPQLLLGEGVGISRADIHYVVTEYGMAYLFGKSIRERALSLIEIASPEFRPWLLEEAKRLHYLPASQAMKSQKAYAIEEERMVLLKNGKSVRLRPAKASDADAFLKLFHALSEEDVYTRFFQRLKTLTFNQAQQLCNVNFEHEAAFIAVEGDRENEKIIGSGCYFLDPSTNIAEVGYMVDPEWQGCGLGKALQNRMKEHAVCKGVRGFLSVVLNSNSKMISLAQKAGDNVESVRDAETWEITVYFD
ncbi:Acetyl-CoA hydrolase/transferase [Syntrophobacter sp. SbD1]|nr:Acetyl-CoA hydrolase/transferase [Syntrophobacter sp. SbD1]